MDHLLPERWAARLGPLARFELRVVLFGLAVAIAGIPFGLLLQQVATDGPLTAFDESGARWLNRRLTGNPSIVRAMEVISFLGKPVFLAVVIGLPALWLLRRGARRLAIFLVVTAIGGGAVDTIVKLAVGRPRPTVDEPVAVAFGKSFPSGHSMSSVFCYGALLLVFLPLFGRWRRLAMGATAALIAAIGLSRLALGVHYLTDVLGGYLLGAAWLAASVAAFEIWRDERHRPPVDPLRDGVDPEEALAAADGDAARDPSG